MKKHFKIVALFVSVAAMFGFIMHTNAQQTVTNTVQVTLAESGTTYCTLWDYSLAGDTSFSSQKLTDNSNSLECTFYGSGVETVTLQLSGDLEDGSNIIPGTWVELTTLQSNFTSNAWTVVWWSTVAYTGQEFKTSSVTLFDKNAYTMGSITLSNVQIDVNIPAYTPAGTYTQNADLVF